MTYTAPVNIPDVNDNRFLQFLQEEFNKLAQDAFQTNSSILSLRELHVEPDKPREGFIVFADGTDWNPGAGKGVYVYASSAWTKL